MYYIKYSTECTYHIYIYISYIHLWLRFGVQNRWPGGPVQYGRVGPWALAPCLVSSLA